jgi:hypothetical protein
MSDTEAPLSEDTPTPDSDTPEVPWQKRYEDLRPEYDRTTQRLKDEESVWTDEQAALARVQEKFPHWFEDEEENEDEGDFEDDDQPDPSQFVTRKEFDELRAWKQDRDGERSKALFEEHLSAEIDLKAEIEDQAAAAKVHDWIYDRTLSLQAKTRDGQKALKQAVEEYRAITDGIAPKKKPRAPHVPKGGSAGTGVKDFSQMTRDEVDEWMVERARALEAQ